MPGPPFFQKRCFSDGQLSAFHSVMMLSGGSLSLPIAMRRETSGMVFSVSESSVFYRVADGPQEKTLHGYQDCLYRQIGSLPCLAECKGLYTIRFPIRSCRSPTLSKNGCRRQMKLSHALFLYSPSVPSVLILSYEIKKARNQLRAVLR